MNMQIKRDQSADMLRGVMICFMVMGHIGYGDRFDLWIHAFHMPVFFVLAGYFFKPETSLKDKLIKMTRKTLLPYFVVSLFTYLLWITVEGRKTLDRLPGMLQNIFWVNTVEFPVAGALWFLTALFCAEMIFATILRCRVTGSLKAGMTVAFAIIGGLFPRIISVRLPWGLDIAFTAVGMIGIGYAFRNVLRREIREKLLSLSIPVLLIASIAISGLIFANGHVNMKFLEYNNLVLYWLNAAAATLLSWNLCRRFVVAAEKNVQILGALRFFAKCGRDSIVFLCFNQLVIRCIQEIVRRLPVIVSFPISSIVTTVGTIVLLSIISLFFHKTSLRALFGFQVSL